MSRTSSDLAGAETDEEMMATSKQSLISTLLILFLACASTLAQDSTRTLKSADDVMEDVLDLTDPAISIWPTVNTVEVEAFSSVVDDLREAYEADRLEADERTRLIESMISDSEEDEELIDEKIDAADEVDDEERKAQLKELLDLYELRRDYLERIAKLRGRERELAEARIDYVGQLAEVLKLARDLLAAREAADQTNLLATERELIRQSHQLGERLDAVAGNLKRVNSERQKAFEEREELISADN